MAIDVDWVSGLISVPRADMPIVQVSPEIRGFDVGQFHQDLRAIHGSEQGAPYSRTHNHKGETVLSGLTYARSVEIISPYTVEYEDGQYAVQSFGANHNILDVKVANQVSLLVQNSAGMIQAPVEALQADVSLLRYQGAVWIDTANGTAGFSVDDRNGTPELPVTTLTDALTLADATGLRRIVVVSGNLTLTDSLTEFLVELRNESELNFGGQNINGTEFRGGVLKGTMTGSVTIRNSLIEDVSGLLGHVSLSGVKGTVVLAAGTTTFAMCHSHEPGLSTPTLDFNGPGAKANVRAWSGGWQIENMNDVTNVATFEYLGGQCVIDSSCTNDATLVLRGAVKIINNSTLVPNTDGAVDDLVWAAIRAQHIDAGSMGGVLDSAETAAVLARQVLINRLEMDFSAQELVLYDDTHTTILQRWPMETDLGELITTQLGVQTKRKAPLL